MGSEHLQRVFAEVKESQNNLAVEFVDLSIRLDHFEGLPKKDVIDLYDKIRKKLYAANLLRRLIRDHLYLFEVPYRDRQELCAKLGIASEEPQMLLPDEKRMKK